MKHFRDAPTLIQNATWDNILTARNDFDTILRSEL